MLSADLQLGGRHLDVSPRMIIKNLTDNRAEGRGEQ